MSKKESRTRWVGGKEYQRAKEILISRYGDPHKVLSSFFKELRSIKPLKTGVSSGLKKLYIFLLKINAIVQGQYWNTLDALVKCL